MAKIRRPADRIGAAYRDDAAEVFGEGEGNGTSHATATGKAGEIGLIGIDGVLPAHVIEDIEDDAGALADSGVVAGAVGGREQDALGFAEFLPTLPAAGGIAGR